MSHSSIIAFRKMLTEDLSFTIFRYSGTLTLGFQFMRFDANEWYLHIGFGRMELELAYVGWPTYG